MAKKLRKNEGSDKLIPENEWIDPRILQLDEERLLRHPLMQRAFEKVMELHRKKHDIAFISMCTSTRPYSRGVKWRTFKEKYGDMMDLIICSSSGVMVPLEFDDCYPFMTYNVDQKKRNEELYLKIINKRMNEFLDRFNYKYVIFNFRPTLNVVKVAQSVKRHSNHPENIYIYPSHETYELAKSHKFKPYSIYYSDLSNDVMGELNGIIRDIQSKG